MSHCEYQILSNSLPITEIHNTGHALQNNIYLTVLARANWQIFLIFENAQNTGYLYDITLIFDKCHHSWTAETPDKYERDRRYLTYTFANLKFPVMEN